MPGEHRSLSAATPGSVGRHEAGLCAAVLTTSARFPKTACVPHFLFHILAWLAGLHGINIIDHCVVILLQL